MGHKGFALGLLVEALTSALGGAGRSDPTSHWGASVFLQIIDPQGFGGRAAFIREAGWTAQACRDSSAIDDANPVRTPGERGVMLREQQLRNGISLNPDTVAAITDCAHNLGIPMPNPVT
jgi:LDH2 family malate/lactate/ureidoglycolate dehydrogenase